MSKEISVFDRCNVTIDCKLTPRVAIDTLFDGFGAFSDPACFYHASVAEEHLGRQIAGWWGSKVTDIRYFTPSELAKIEAAKG
jgi:hypothetical protein